MFNYLKGIVTDTSFDLTVECNGVGYLVTPTSALFNASKDCAGEQKIYVHHDVKETSQTFYGFISVNERELFRKLITLNGIGPKVALSLLSIGEEKLVNAILTENVVELSNIKGVSDKVAQKVILELKTKLAKGNWGAGAVSVGNSSATMDAVMGLVNLGLSRTVAGDLVCKVKVDGKSAEEIIVEALKLRG